MEEFIGTRTGAQIRSHAQKFFLKIQRELSAEPFRSMQNGPPETSEPSTPVAQSHHDQPAPPSLIKTEQETDEQSEPPFRRPHVNSLDSSNLSPITKQQPQD